MATNVKVRRIGAVLVLTIFLLPIASALAQGGSPPVAPTPATGELAKVIKQGNAAIRKGEYDHAIKIFKDAVGSAPNSPDAALGLSWAYIKERQFVEAIETTVIVLKTAPDNPRALSLYGTAMMRIGWLGEAQKAFLKAV